VSLLQLDNIAAAPWGEPVLADISLSLPAGRVLAVLGGNGAGKSSLLRLVAGDIAASRGRASFAGQALGDWPRRQLATRLACLPQFSSLSFPFSVEEVVLLGRTPHSSGRQQDRLIAQQAMQATDTLGLRHRLYTQLSGGERQRVQLARVMAQILDRCDQGCLLLLDEPTTALDLNHQQQLQATVADLAGRGCAVLLVVHDVNLAAAMADQLLVLDRGRCAAQGSPGEVLTPALFRDLFHADVLIGEHPDGGRPLVISR